MTTGASLKPGPLHGIKVADFTVAGAGPYTVKTLADFGAQIVKVESTHGRELLRVSAPFKDGKVGVDRSLVYAFVNSNKYSITLNLNHPRAPEVTKRLVAWADLIVDNFSAGTMEKWGLDYEKVRKIKPDIIMLRESQQGQTGPFAKQPGYGFQTLALAGFCHFTGWPDREPCGPATAYTDNVAPWFGLSALLAALDYRRRTGKGQYIDLSILEAGSIFLSPAHLDYSVNKRTGERRANRSVSCVPHGAYRCSGEDRWCAIAVSNDAEWQAFCSAIRRPRWARDARFATVLGRKQNEDELDRLVEAWTVRFAAEEVMSRLQRAGVPAGVVQNPADLFNDPQLKQMEFLRTLDHPLVGRHTCTAGPIRLTKTPAEARMPAPCLGQHNDYVYVKLLGFSDTEFIELLEQGVFE